MLIVSDLVRCVGPRRALLFSSVGVSLGLGLIPNASDYATLLFLFLLTGVFFGVLVTLPGVIVSAVMGAQSGETMNFVYSFFALGVMTAPVAAGEMFIRGWSWWGPFLLPILPAFFVAASALWLDLPSMKEPSGLSLGVLRELWRERGLFIGGLAAVLLYVASEATVGFWAPKYISETFPAQVGLARASRVLTWFWAGLTVGRMASAPILKIVKPTRFLIILTIAGTLTTGVAPHIGSPVLMEWAFALAGVWYAGVYPTLVSFSGRLGPKLAPLAFSLMTASGQVGAITLPPTVGYAAVHIPFAWAMSLTALPLLALAVLVGVLDARGIFQPS